MAGFMDLSVASLTKKLRLASPADYGPVLSKAFKKVVSFKTSDPKFRFDRAVADGAAGSHWDIVAYLAKNGELTINGHDLAFWTGIRQNLLSGGGFDLCAGPVPAKVIVDELSFISGTRYSIISGDPKTMVSGPFTGDTISELINTLDQKANITIAEK
ncbi:MAG: hypothetical protein DYH05_08250 [Acidobacteria bacterium ACB1]|nr:hypothetical protein [Pyrinomonadaceae bacterium]MCE7962473.1 hypothetical protein [Acidobacteria bacterium ACB1]RIJ93746.1 MAG: hypothetical protein DCC44_06380 [Acidobacteriota bacterium]